MTAEFVVKDEKGNVTLAVLLGQMDIEDILRVEGEILPVLQKILSEQIKVGH